MSIASRTPMSVCLGKYEVQTIRPLCLIFLVLAFIQTGSHAKNALAPVAVRIDLAGAQGVVDSYRRLGGSLARSVRRVGSSIKKSAKGQRYHRQRPRNRETRKR